MAIDTSDDDDIIDDDDENVFANDGYVEPTMADDEAFRWRPASAPRSLVPAALRPNSQSASNDGAYAIAIASSHDGTRVGVVTTANKVRVYERDAQGGTKDGFFAEVGVASANDCAFASSADPHAMAVACGDGACRMYDTRMRLSTSVASVRAPFNAQEVESCALGGGSSDVILALSVGPHVAFYDRRLASAAPFTVFQDAHSEVVTRVRFHPERRSNLYTSSVDGLVCAFDCGKANALNDEDALISIMSTGAAVNNIGFCRSGASAGNDRDAVWCTTGIEEVHIFVAGGEARRVGVPLAHIVNARERAQSICGAHAPDFATQVDYVIGIHDGVAPGELYLSAGTQSGAVGVFPLVQGAAASAGTPDFVTLGEPVAILRNGHRDIVRAMYWDANAAMPEAARVPLTCGEDSLVCSWRPGEDNDVPPVDRTRPPGRRHSPY